MKAIKKLIALSMLAVSLFSTNITFARNGAAWGAALGTAAIVGTAAAASNAAAARRADREYMQYQAERDRAREERRENEAQRRHEAAKMRHEARMATLQAQQNVQPAPTPMNEEE